MRLNRRTTGAATAAVLAAATTLVGGWEGLKTKAYRDPIGIATVCYGETDGVRMGDSYTVEECQAKLEVRLAEFDAALTACALAYATLPTYTRVAIVSFAYNVGTGAACSSTLMHYVRAGDYEAACDQLPRWNKAGGRVLAGLVRRRAAERILCHAGLDGDEFEWSEVLP